MGITIVQKSDPAKSRPKARRALVLAGGAISGGAFKLGGLLALDRFFGNYRVTDFDIYMGISAGAFLAAPLAAGIEPVELVEALYGSTGRVSMFHGTDFYRLNWREFIQRPAWLAADVASYGPRLARRLIRVLPSERQRLQRRARDFLAEPSRETAEALVEPLLQDLTPRSRGRGYVPSGIFDNGRIETYIRKNLERNDLPNTFRQLKLVTGKSLYIGATNLDTGQGIVFGHDEDNSATVSQAVQASTAIPGFFRPARIGPQGRELDYCDAAIRRTANISTAVRHGAELIVCYNPFRPFVNYRHRLMASERRSIQELGLYAIINQAFRTMLHSRLRLGIEKLRLDANFKGDVILIEPQETDARFFAMNPLAFWKRKQAFAHGYESVKASLTRHHHTLQTIFNSYGINVDLAGLAGNADESRRSQSRARPQQAHEPEEPKLRLVSGRR